VIASPAQTTSLDYWLSPGSLAPEARLGVGARIKLAAVRTLGQIFFDTKVTQQSCHRRYCYTCSTFSKQRYIVLAKHIYVLPYVYNSALGFTAACAICLQSSFRRFNSAMRARITCR
jgi:hypothetical protein